VERAPKKLKATVVFGVQMRCDHIPAQHHTRLVAHTTANSLVTNKPRRARAGHALKYAFTTYKLCGF
jgi:hypothetical protein